MKSSSFEAASMWVRPKYLVEDWDRHGNNRIYYCKPGQKKVRIREELNTPQFWAAYHAAAGPVVSADDITGRPEMPSGLRPNTFHWLCAQYFESTAFKSLDETTRRKKRTTLESCCREPVRPGSERTYADAEISAITTKAIEILRDRKGVELPEAANHRLKALRVLFKWASSKYPALVRLNPAAGVERFHSASEGFHTWTAEEVEQYMNRHGPGTQARRALVLFMCTGARKSDAIRFGRQHYKLELDTKTKCMRAWLHFTAWKNRNRHPVHLKIPVLPPLKAEIDALPRGQLTFLESARKAPFTLGGFGNRMRRWCDQAKLPQCSSHGLRKAAATFAAENGATETELMMIFGWIDPKMAAHYTRKARQKRIAGTAMSKLSFTIDQSETDAVGASETQKIVG